jgi:hypothetical protein
VYPPVQPTLAAAPPKKPRVLAIALVCFGLGCGVGFAAGVLSVRGARDFVVGLSRTEAPAEVSKPVTIDRPAFQLQYPGNWRVDTKDEDYDPDRMFSVDSPGQSFAMFFISEAPVEASIQGQVSAQTAKVMKDASQTPFTSWGGHTGKGVLLAGKQLGMTPGSVRIFAFREREMTYTVVESTYDDDRADVQPGFDLIARTFRVKGP